MALTWITPLGIDLEFALPSIAKEPLAGILHSLVPKRGVGERLIKQGIERVTETSDEL